MILIGPFSISKLGPMENGEGMEDFLAYEKKLKGPKSSLSLACGMILTNLISFNY